MLTPAGHAPKTLAERGHYFGDKRFRMVEVFLEHVTAKIDVLLGRIQGSEWNEMTRIVEISTFAEQSA